MIGTWALAYLVGYTYLRMHDMTVHTQCLSTSDTLGLHYGSLLLRRRYWCYRGRILPRAKCWKYTEIETKYRKKPLPNTEVTRPLSAEGCRIIRSAKFLEEVLYSPPMCEIMHILHQLAYNVLHSYTLSWLLIMCSPAWTAAGLEPALHHPTSPNRKTVCYGVTYTSSIANNNYVHLHIHSRCYHFNC